MRLRRYLTSRTVWAAVFVGAARIVESPRDATRWLEAIGLVLGAAGLRGSPANKAAEAASRGAPFGALLLFALVGCAPYISDVGGLPLDRRNISVYHATSGATRTAAIAAEGERAVTEGVRPSDARDSGRSESLAVRPERHPAGHSRLARASREYRGRGWPSGRQVPRRGVIDARVRLLELIAQSGLAAGPFGRLVLGVQDSTVYRWLAGGPMSEVQSAQLLRIEGVLYDSRHGRVLVAVRSGVLDTRSLTPERRKRENAPKYSGAFAASRGRLGEGRA